MLEGYSNRLLDTKRAASLLNCSPAAMAKFRVERRGPPYIKVGRLIRYRRIDLIRWLKSCRVSPEQSTKPERGMRASGRA